MLISKYIYIFHVKLTRLLGLCVFHIFECFWANIGWKKALFISGFIGSYVRDCFL